MMWLTDGNARRPNVKIIECTDPMSTKTDGGESRVFALRANLDQLNQDLDVEGNSCFLRRNVWPWTFVELSRKDQEIPAFPKPQAA